MVMVDILTTSPVIRFLQHVLCERTLKKSMESINFGEYCGGIQPSLKK